MQAENETTTKKSVGVGYLGSMSAIAIGVIATFILFWFFGGFGFWSLPGMIIIFLGIASIFINFLSEKLPKPNSTLWGGLILLFVGLACFLSFAPNVLLGTFQIITLSLTIIGILVSIKGLYDAVKK